MSLPLCSVSVSTPSSPVSCNFATYNNVATAFSCVTVDAALPCHSLQVISSNDPIRSFRPFQKYALPVYGSNKEPNLITGFMMAEYVEVGYPNAMRGINGRCSVNAGTLVLTGVLSVSHHCVTE